MPQSSGAGVERNLAYLKVSVIASLIVLLPSERGHGNTQPWGTHIHFDMCSRVGVSWKPHSHPKHWVDCKTDLCDGSPAVDGFAFLNSSILGLLATFHHVQPSFPFI